MTVERKKAFISYSWDTPQHEQWVLDLNNSLRGKGVICTIDKTITQQATTNLNTMMVQNMKNNDYIIIVLTENYAQKADNLQGGVGFETTLSLPILQENPEKLIFILRHKGKFADAFPFHLKGYYAIDFSDDTQFDDKFAELQHRIYSIPLYEEAPIGDIPNLQPRKTILKESQPSIDFSYVSLSSLNTVTDLDKEMFLFQNYKEINNQLEQLFQHVNTQDPSIKYTQDVINDKKHIYKIYVNGMLKTGVKTWLGSSFGGSSNINFSFGHHLEPFNDNTMNGMLSCEVNNNNEMTLKGLIGLHNQNQPMQPDNIIKQIWESHLIHYIK
ncbi:MULTISPECIES: toll/interleukin-1 receptor domain-containing protein [Bacillus cereus group]|uniref:toll/interleukin-1 receptor domain-containing protein n=1 Tax=Bacillus cereus group TaxID=86661 RepID=UPI0022E710F6|nr:toll/interleukin-1 receptor domain-containing protein [Bacillus cereus group sp. BY105LC]MDA1887241.1 toll/interleukin-1 receptor domain-containing protein [Bacillus cereus group sp. BY105LC]